MRLAIVVKMVVYHGKMVCVGCNDVVNATIRFRVDLSVKDSSGVIDLKLLNQQAEFMFHRHAAYFKSLEEKLHPISTIVGNLHRISRFERDMPNSSYGIENSGDIICLESEDDDIVCPRPTEDEEVHRDEIPLDSDIAETEKKLSVYVAQSEDEAYALYQDYANLVGFSVRKGKQYYINGTKIIRSKSYLCSKEGVKDERPRSNGTRKRHTSRTHSIWPTTSATRAQAQAQQPTEREENMMTSRDASIDLEKTLYISKRINLISRPMMAYPTLGLRFQSLPNLWEKIFRFWWTFVVRLHATD
ncbi:hypothetical protein BUALT_Bualt14G0128000 [Buddleja alternifolia]|uniref:FAR1 domain-containing protein n=1 Tax=Buddleja alternifolia TaxID=168488 RepID=A0AAV6WJ00_9LAMI|nr:hypothetical protein BUALT_Bualt14G0128000 [Buddleja alternifolia]